MPAAARWMKSAPISGARAVPAPFDLVSVKRACKLGREGGKRRRMRRRRSFVCDRMRLCARARDRQERLASCAWSRQSSKAMTSPVFARRINTCKPRGREGEGEIERKRENEAASAPAKH
jgi:hypothetical protein